MAMAGRESNPQKQLLNLIRNFAAEKSQGERRVVTLRKQIEKLTSELSEANAELENSKRCKELVEQELKGFEVQLFLNEASVQTLEARVSLIRDEISAVGSDLETIKNEEAALRYQIATLRDQFINNMLHLNAKIRKFLESIITCNIDAVDCAATRDAPQVIMKENDAEVALRALESQLLEIISETAQGNEEYQAEQKIYENVQQQLIDYERKVSLMKMIVMETKELQDLTMESSKLEATYNSLGEELQRRCMCPSCHLDNLDLVGELVANQENDVL